MQTSTLQDRLENKVWYCARIKPGLNPVPMPCETETLAYESQAENALATWPPCHEKFPVPACHLLLTNACLLLSFLCLLKLQLSIVHFHQLLKS